MRLCSIGFSLCVFPVAGSPGFQSGGARLQACGKSASTRRASAPALRPVAQPFLAVRLWSVGSPLTAFFATSFTKPPSHCHFGKVNSPLRVQLSQAVGAVSAHFRARHGHLHIEIARDLLLQL